MTMVGIHSSWCDSVNFTIFEFILTDAVPFSNAHFGAGIGPIHLHAVGCTGRETNLTDCPDIHSNVSCLQGHSGDAGVRCQGLKILQIITCGIIMQVIWDLLHSEPSEN